MTTPQKVVLVLIILLVLGVIVGVCYYLGLFGGEDGAGGSGSNSGTFGKGSVFGRGSGLRVGSVSAVEERDADSHTTSAANKAATLLRSTASASVPIRRASGKLTLERKLRYASWSITPLIFHVCSLVISFVVMGLASINFSIIYVALCIVAGPIAMNAALNFSTNRKFKAFDQDYAPFLLSVVGLLKTGMNPMNGIEAAAKGLSEDSSVRAEVEMMIERLRFGVPEDKSIGAFGEDIYHPEIELFVQALLLSRRVGGTLSDTLERLSKQVRKRQYFRESANAAVGLQRGSIWFILVILAGLEAYLYFVYPEAVVGAMKNEIGWKVWQFGLTVIALGMLWVRQVTKIRV